MSPSERLVFPDAMRGITIVMVVAIHARAYAVLPADVEAVVFPIVSTIAVPSFFLCDGFLFLLRRGAGRFDYKDHIRRSALRLLVPWALFSVGYALVRMVFESAGLLDPVLIDGGPLAFVREIYGSGVAPQMYFLASLFLIRLAAPVTRRMGGAPLLVSWCAFVAYTVVYRTWLSEPLSSSLSYGFDPILHAAWGFQFYLLGAALARSIDQVRPHVLGAALLCSAVLGLAWALGAAAAGFPFVVQYAYLLALWFACWTFERSLEPVARLGRDSMGIYLLHTPIVLRGLALVVTPVLVVPEAVYVVIVTGAVAVSWVATRLLMGRSWGRMLFGVF